MGAGRKEVQLCSSGLPVLSCDHGGTRQDSRGSLCPPGMHLHPGAVQTLHTKHQPGLICTQRGARLTRAPGPLLPLRKVLIHIARAHSEVVLGTLPSLLARVTSQHPPCTRQTHPSGYWSRDKLNSLQPFCLPKPTVFTEQPKINIA